MTAPSGRLPLDDPDPPLAPPSVAETSAVLAEPPAVLTVRDGPIELPYADSVLARTLLVSGLPTDQALAVAAQVGRRLIATGAASVPVDRVRAETAAVLRERDLTAVLGRLRARWWLRSTRTPVVIAVGGTSGVGKSTAGEGLARVLGIDGVFSTDLVRAVLRGTLNRELIPALSESSFSARRMLRSNLEGDPLLVAFEQQASIVERASASLVRRALKEGVQLVINGVHIVPGLADVPADWPLFTYVLTVPELEEHKSRFVARFATSDRDPGRYLSRIQAIRALDDYIVSHSRRAGIPVIESREKDQTLYDLVDAVTADLEAAFDLDQAIVSP